MDTTKEQDAQTVWNEVSAERAAGDVALATKPVAKPVAKPVVESVAVPKVEEVKPDQLAEITAKLTELEKVAGRVRTIESHVGNLGHSQKELKSLLEASQTAAKSVGDAPSASEIKQAATNPKEWEELRSDYPEWANATEKLLDSRLQGQVGFDAKAFESNLKKQMEGQSAAIRKEIIESSLEAVFPDWKTEINTEEFRNWTNTQTDAVKALLNSERVGDAAKMLGLYEKSKALDPSNQIKEQRAKNLAAATGTPKSSARAPTTKSWDDMSTAERWEYEKRSRAKRAG